MKPLGKLNQRLAKGSRERIWREALQESCEHTRGLVLRELRDIAELCRGSEDGPRAASSVTAAGREAPGGALIAISRLL